MVVNSFPKTCPPMNLPLRLLQGHYTIVQLPADEPIPGWAQGEAFMAIVRTHEELSIVCETEWVPEDVHSEHGWRVIGVSDVLDFSLVGILADISNLLASAGVSIFAISTFNTDYILVKQNQLGIATETLRRAGHRINEA